MASVDSYVVRLAPADPRALAIPDPTKWAAESEDLARRYVYAPPVDAGTGTIAMTMDYRTTAKKVAAGQIELALLSKVPAQILLA